MTEAQMAVLKELRRGEKDIYTLSKDLDKSRYAIAVQCKWLEDRGFVRSRLEKRQARMHHYYSLEVYGLCWLFIMLPVDWLVDVAKSNIHLLPELFGSQFFSRHPEDVCLVLRSAILDGGIVGGPLIPKEPQDVYFRFIHFLVISLLNESQDDLTSPRNYYNLLAEALTEEIAVSWWRWEALILLFHLARFWQRAERFVEFQDRIAQTSLAAKIDFTELTTIVTLTKQLPEGFRELLAQRFGINWQKRNYGEVDIIPPELLDSSKTGSCGHS